MSDGGRMSRDTACNGQSRGDVGAEGRRLRILHVVIQAGPTNSQWNEHCVPVADEREITVCSLYPGTVDPDPRISRIEGDGSLRGAVSALRTALRRRDYDVVHVHVRDEGIGIDPDDQRRVFQSFFQSAPPVTDLRGTGAVGMTAHAVEDQQDRSVLGYDDGGTILVVLTIADRGDLGILDLHLRDFFLVRIRRGPRGEEHRFS